MEKKEDVVQTSIKEALESVDNNRGDKKDESTQQLQKLKSSTTDLKVRYDTVSSLEITGSGFVRGFKIDIWAILPFP